MADKYCDNCGYQCMSSLRVCPSCGNNSFSSTPIEGKELGIHQQSLQTVSGEKTEEPRAVTAAKATWEVESQKKSKELKGVRGWLMFFVIIQVFIAPILCGVQVVELIALLQTAPDSGLKNWLTFLCCNVALLTFFGMFVGIQIWKIKQDAIKHAKIFLKLAVLFNIFWALVMTYKFENGSLASSITPIVVSIVWHIYFNSSSRVRNTFG